VNYKVTQEREIEELIKRWIPHVKVLEPASLRYNINDELKKYLNL
jgi:predicted DNA-binding transcriptional regulator YafY